MKTGIKIVLALLLICMTITAQKSEPGPNIEVNAVKKVAPIYPPLAKRKRVEGKVIVWLEVHSDGSVGGIEFLEGNALFKPSSLEAAKQWVFQKSSGGMTGHITFRFQLEEQ